MIFQTINPHIKTGPPTDVEFDTNKGLGRIIQKVHSQMYRGAFDRYELEIDEEFFLSFLSHDHREQACSQWPFERRAMWPQYLMGLSVKYTRNAGWNIMLKCVNEQDRYLCDTGTSEVPPYE
jgi:hypothetical protein